MQHILYRVSVLYLLVCFFVFVNLLSGTSPFPYCIYLLFALPIAAATVVVTAPPLHRRWVTNISYVAGFMLFLGSLGASAPFILPELCYVAHGLHTSQACSQLFLTYGAFAYASVLLLLLGMLGFIPLHWHAWRSLSPDPARRKQRDRFVLVIVCILVVCMFANFVRNLLS